MPIPDVPRGSEACVGGVARGKGRKNFARAEEGLILRARSAFSSVFYRLLGAFVFLVFIVAVVVAASSYMFFRARYSEELRRINLSFMENIEQRLRYDVVNPSTMLFMECAGQLPLPTAGFLDPDDPSDGNSVKIYMTHRYLKEIANRYFDRIEAIHLYFRQAGIVISSSSGLHSRDRSSGESPGEAWYRLVKAGAGTSGVWAPFSDPAGPLVIKDGLRRYASYWHFPILADPASASVIIVVELKTDVIASILEQFPPTDRGVSFVVDGAGEPVAATTPPAWSAQMGAAIASVAQKTGGGTRTAVRAIGGTPHLVAIMQVANTGWYLANVIPLAVLYRRSDSISYIVLCICAAAIISGVAVALVLASRIYNPLGLLLGRVKSMVGLKVALPADDPDEYRVLGTAIEGLSSRMDELSATLERNRPVVKHELIAGLEAGDRPQDIAEALRLLERKDFPSVCRAALVSIPAAEAREEAEAGRRAIAFRFAEEIEESGGRSVLATSLGSNRIGLIVAVGTDEEARAAGWIGRAREEFGWSPRVAFGRRVDSLDALHSSFGEAAIFLEYGFFFPETPVFIDRDDLLAQEKFEGALSQKSLDEFESRLIARDREGVTASIRGLAAYARSGTASAARCFREIDSFLALAHKYALSARLGEEEGDEIADRIVALRSESPDIDSLSISFIRTMGTLFGLVESRLDNRSGVAVRNVMEYISAHLAGELSLDVVGEAVGISPKYLSTLFKEETGGNFVAYVTQARLSEARHLVETSDLSIQEISRMVGFNTPAYFIRQFKSRFGVTPYEHRRLVRDGS